MRPIDHALAYARRGWPVFPLAPASKLPAISKKRGGNGHKDATLDEAQIRTWWSENGARGIGMATGDGSGVWVLDLDGESGLRSFGVMQSEHGTFTETLCAETGGGGLHLFFALPAGVEVRNRAGIEPGVDVRGTGGYVVLPPSGHPSGRDYAWLDESMPIVEAPAWLLDLVVKPKREAAPGPALVSAAAAPRSEPIRNYPAYARGALRDAVAKIQGAASGTGNIILNEEAYSLREFVDDGWLQRSDVESELQLAAESRGTPAGEARKTIASGLGASSGRDLHAVREPAATPAAPVEQARQQVLATPAPMGVAHAFIEDTATDPKGRLTLRRWRHDWWRWTGSAYRVLKEERLNADLWKWSDRLWVAGKDGRPVPYQPSTAKVANLIAALRSHDTLVDDEAEPPVWVGDGSDMVSGPVVVAVDNGLLDMASGQLCPSSPNLFVTASIPVAWDPMAGAPVEWLRFLGDLWPNDPESIQLVQEWFGYCLTPDTSQQKMLMIVGPKRGGKGTIYEVLRALLGAGNITAATLSGITKDFGLQPFLSKLVAVFPDVRLSGQTDSAEVAERLLMVSGEDAVPINRKFLTSITAKLPTRIVMLSNEVPKMADSSGALASRFLLLQLHRSFYGEEDRGLKARLLAELPAILRWAVEGWRRLQARGRFVQPAGSEELQEDLEELGSPIQAFVRDVCVVAPDAKEVCSYVYKAYGRWSRLQGYKHVPPMPRFGRDLKASVGGLRTVRGERPSRAKTFVGIKLDERARAELMEQERDEWH